MYLAAQRVRAPTGEDGINAFRYEHGYEWVRMPPFGIPDEDPGVLVNEILTISPPGNIVRSYLDIIAPDGAFWPEIRPAFFAFVGNAQRQRFPWDGFFGRCRFRVGMDRPLARQWRVEIAHLYRACEAVDPARLV